MIAKCLISAARRQRLGSIPRRRGPPWFGRPPRVLDGIVKNIRRREKAHFRAGFVSMRGPVRQPRAKSQQNCRRLVPLSSVGILIRRTVAMRETEMTLTDSFTRHPVWRVRHDGARELNGTVWFRLRRGTADKVANRGLEPLKRLYASNIDPDMISRGADGMAHASGAIRINRNLI
jgi:hypothetical protein